MMATIYDFSPKDIEGKAMNLSLYKNKVILVVNIASQCGFTPQYKELEALYKEYKDKGLIILGFPCNQFGAQESGSDKDIQEFCSLNFNISFPLFSKIEVNGKDTEPLYDYLKNEQKGLLGTKAIKWNFTKFLVNQKGEVLHRFAPSSTVTHYKKFIDELL